MAKKASLIENFEKLNNVKLDESLVYAHVDSAAPEPSRDKYQIGMETVGLNETDPLASTNTNSSIKKEVRYLSIGDILTPTGAKVISGPIAGYTTPKGKMEVGLEYPNGKKVLALWGKYTVVTVKPKEVQPPQIENPV
jgi:hypothetical protein